jgi:chaperonin GroES
MPLRPLATKVVIEPAKQEEQTASGIYLPDAAQKKPFEGTVVAVGKGTTLEDGTVHPLSVNPGDTVVYSKYGGTEIKLGGEEYLILSARDILAVVEQ